MSVTILLKQAAYLESQISNLLKELQPCNAVQLQKMARRIHRAIDQIQEMRQERERYRSFEIYREGFKNRNMSRRRPEFGPGEAGIEAAKLEKFSDADGSQIQWLSDEDSADFSITSGIKELDALDRIDLCLMAIATHCQSMIDHIEQQNSRWSRIKAFFTAQCKSFSLDINF